MGRVKVIIKRPASHYIIIVTYIFAPLVNVILINILGDVSYSLIIRNFFNGFGLFAGLWLITAPLVGIGFFFVHKISWYIFIGHSCLILLDFIVKWLGRPLYYLKTISGSHNILMLIGNLLLIIIVGYIIQKDFRAPYFQALQRHWRESSRIPINHVIMIDGINMKTNDLSPGGCFALVDEKNLDLERDHSISFKSDKLEISCLGQIMRQTENGYGIMFKNITKHQKMDIHHFLKKRFALRQKINV